MATNDISRSAFYLEKDYADLGMQQGRVLTDDDYNEGRQIARELHRRTRVDLIGSYGSPDQGFFIDKATAKNAIDFEIYNGTFYIGGLRIELSKEETFQLQKNWLQHIKETASDKDGHLVYLEVWQQPVSAVEDSELFEAALGGPDTATRLRTMWRVRLYKVKNPQNDDCAKAWGELVAKWKNGAAGDLKAGNQLIPDTTLTVTFDTKSAQQNLCKPPVTGGYLGADNQAIRVEVGKKDKTFTWGFDSGSLYRVTVSSDNQGDRTLVKMLTEPKDETHWPKAGQVVEFLPWAAVLVNGEKLAEESEPGQFAKVESTYDPVDKIFKLTSATKLKDNFGNTWTYRSDKDELLKNPFTKEKLDEYLFMRVWDRGDDTDSDPEIPMIDKAKLGTTGLQVTFNNNDHCPGDYWIIAARPETPNRVVPWQLEAEKKEVQRPPDGIRRFYAPLAIIEWHKDGNQLKGKVQDCRKTFRPLTEIQTCCTRTVGDGTQSHGDFSDLQKAIDSLPAAGGDICLLPGEYTHQETVILKNINNVTLRGCGERSMLLAPIKDGPVVQIEDCEYVQVSSLGIRATTGVAIELKGKAVKQIEQQPATLKYIALTDLTIRARDRAAIVCGNGSFIRLQDNRVSFEKLEKNLAADKNIGREPAIFLQADDLLLESNQIIADSSQGAPRTTLGGLQIGGGSERVEIRRNKIEAGNGNGITLGSVRYVTAGSTETSTPDLAFWGHTLSEDAAGCIRLIPQPKPPAGAGGVNQVLTSDGHLSEVRIMDNLIQKMGGNGIGVAHFFNLSAKESIGVHKLVIENNQIRGCRHLALQEIASRDIGYGGIALATGQYPVIRNNLIENNGTSLFPTCGIFILHGIGTAIEGNRILYNGGSRERTGNEAVSKWGNRGGIVISFAQPKTEAVTVTEAIRRSKLIITRQDGIPAARIHDNIVVSPEGRALQLLAVGPVSVQSNHFTSHGSHSLKPESNSVDSLGGAVVTIINLGISNEMYGSLLGLFDAKEAKKKQPRPSIGGNVQFNDNQIVFDVLDKSPSNTFSSILLFSLDDVSMTANQSDCDLSVGDFMVTNALVLGISVRVADNRFKEGLLSALASAATLGWFNSTTDNQGTHCFLTNGIGNLSMPDNNRNLNFGKCEELQSKWKEITKSLIPGRG